MRAMEIISHTGRQPPNNTRAADGRMHDGNDIAELSLKSRVEISATLDRN